jgi:hypothetical protein
VQSSGDSNGVISIKIEGEEVCIKEEDDPIALSISLTKDDPVVSPQTFLPNLRLPSVIMLFCLSFHINQLPMLNGNGLYIFTDYVKYKG